MENADFLYYLKMTRQLQMCDLYWIDSRIMNEV